MTQPVWEQEWEVHEDEIQVKGNPQRPICMIYDEKYLSYRKKPDHQLRKEVEETAKLLAALPLMRKRLLAVLMLHETPINWKPQDWDKWRDLTGQECAGTNDLCDSIREILPELCHEPTTTT